MLKKRQILIVAAALLAFLAVSQRQALYARTSPPPDVLVDVNHASLEELMKVPGMTLSWAGRIIRFRPYRTKADLVEHGVVTSSVYKRIKDSVIAHRNPQ